MSATLVDFLPPDYRLRRSRKKWVRAECALALLALIGMAGATHVTRKDAAALGDELRTVRAQHEDASHRIAAVERLELKKEELSRRMAVLKDVLARTRGALLLDAIGRAGGESTQLTRIILQRVEEGSEPRVAITIEGACPDYQTVVATIDRLDASPWIDEARLVVSEAVQGFEGRRKFVITAFAPAVLPKPIEVKP